MKNWTIMVYMAGDNNLSEDMVTALKSFKNVGDNNEKINLLARYDSVFPPVPTGYYEFKKSDLALTKNLVDCKVKDESSDADHSRSINTGSTLEDFVKWSHENYPAQEYILILSGHGDAFRGQTFLYDETPAGSVSLTKLKESLQKIKTMFGGKLAILGFDCCAMNLLEITNEFQEFADYLVSSEGFTPKSGWAYEKVLEKTVNESDTISSEDIAKEFVSEFSRFHRDYALGGRSVEMSVTKLTETSAVVTSLNNLAAELLKIFPNPASETSTQTDEFIREHFKKMILCSHWKAQTFFWEQTVDLYDFCELLKSECDQLSDNIEIFRNGADSNELTNALISKLKSVSDSCQKVLETASNFVVHNTFSGTDFQFSKGISIYFPWSNLSFSISKDIYKEFAINKISPDSWMNFLESFTIATIRQVPKLSFEAKWMKFNKLSEDGVRVGSPWKVGSPWRDDMDTLKRYFSNFKNHPLDWKAYKD